MTMLDFLSFELINDPVAVFLIILAIMLVAPLLFERLRLPGIVGLILAGVVVGPEGLGLLERDENIILLGTVGLLFLMFMAGLETSLDDFTNFFKLIKTMMSFPLLISNKPRLMFHSQVFDLFNSHQAETAKLAKAFTNFIAINSKLTASSLSRKY